VHLRSPQLEQSVDNIKVTPLDSIVQWRLSNVIESVHWVLTVQKLVDAIHASILRCLVQLFTLKSRTDVFAH
jgi:hypothetical protein